MKTGEKILCGMLGGSLCAGAAAAWLIAPARPTGEQRDLISGLNFAHRGLYDSGNGVPENSLAAFRLAAEHGYGAELDVRMTRDGVLVIAHDSDLKRMTGADLSIEEHDYEEISGLRLEGTDEGEKILVTRDYRILLPERFRVVGKTGVSRPGAGSVFPALLLT